MRCALSVLWGKSDMTYRLRLCCAAWCLWVHTQCIQPAWPLSAGLNLSTKVQTKSLNHFAVWSSDTVEDEKEGNGRWWEKEWKPGCPSVILIHECTLFPSGLLQWFIYHISPESCISWVYLCWNSHRGVMNMTFFFFTETIPKHGRCQEETPTSLVLLYRKPKRMPKSGLGLEEKLVPVNIVWFLSKTCALLG